MALSGEKKGALNWRNIFFLAAALEFAICCAHAADNPGQEMATQEIAPGDTAPRDMAKDGQHSKELALIHLLARAGRNEEAAAKMRSLYPNGSPVGDLALEYYRIIGDTPEGWNEAKTGLEKLVKAKPGDTNYRLELARHLTTRPTSRLAGIKKLAALAKTRLPVSKKQEVLEAWQHALKELDNNAASIPLYREYLAADPGNASVRDALVSAQRSEAKRLPWKMREKADAQLAAGHPDEAMDTLKNALQLDPENAWVRFDLSRLYHKQGDTERGRALMQEGLTAAPGDADMLYANALYISLLDEAEGALRLLEEIPVSRRSPAMQRLKQNMAILAQTRQAQALARDDKSAEMQEAMQQAEIDAGNDAELVNIVANAWVDLNDPARGLALMRRLAEQPSASIDTRMYYAKLLNRAEQNDVLAPLLDKLSTSSELSTKDTEDLHYLHASMAAHRADSLRQAGNITAAKSVLTVALAQDPENVDMLMAMARIHVAAHEPQQARNIYQQILQRTPGNVSAQLALNKMENEANGGTRLTPVTNKISDDNTRRAEGYVATGVDYLDKQGGTPGISNFTSVDIPVEIHIPVDYSGGLAFVQLDQVSADAGTLPADAYNLSQYGYGVAGANTRQSAQGTTLAAGYIGNGMRVDIGTTPLGFPVSNVVGGVKWSRYTEITGFSFDVSRRPVTSSLVSYAGVHDPTSGVVWGGVLSTGASLHLSRDIGRLNVFVDPGYFWLSGTNVLSNTEYALRAGFDWSFFREENSRLTAGLAFTDWHYRENLRYYTFGHGGYYSPQKYYSLALPIRWTGRKERWSYLLQGSVSASASYEKDMLYYPLEAPAVSNPVYTGGNGHGTGYSLGGSLEYQIAPKLFAGGRLQIDRSEYYTPNFALLYMRYLFDAHTGAVPYPPDPVTPYSRF